MIGKVRGKEIQTLIQANSIEEAFMRMTSPLLNIKPTFLMLIWSIILMRCVRLRNDHVVRRIVRVWKVKGSDLGSKKPIPLDYIEVFR
ncbi:MAG: hypothetical protein J7K21_04500 [Desulfurococcales archaeon]|nr:hypothetical protein [Desulfurococcales archaeon]